MRRSESHRCLFSSSTNVVVVVPRDRRSGWKLLFFFPLLILWKTKKRNIFWRLRQKRKIHFRPISRSTTFIQSMIHQFNRFSPSVCLFVCCAIPFSLHDFFYQLLWFLFKILHSTLFHSSIRSRSFHTFTFQTLMIAVLFLFGFDFFNVW